MAKKSNTKSILDAIFKGSSSASSAKKGSKGSGDKRVKSKEEQRKDIARFGVKVAAAGAVAATAANKKGKKGLATLIVLLCLVIFGVGVMYYFDVTPLDFVLEGIEFKYYTYQVSSFDNTLTPVAATGEMRIHFIDVGQGDSIFIEFPDGKKMLIDGGERRTAVAEGIPAYILGLYPDSDSVTIDYCMLTHCDSDHSGSLDDVIKHDKIDVLNVYQPRVYSAFANDPLKALVAAGESDEDWDNIPEITTGVYKSFVEAVYNEREQLGDEFGDIYYNQEGMFITSSLDATNPDYWSIHMYNPSEELYKEKLSTAYDKNNISPIMVLQYAGQDILLTGDADEAAESNFIDKLSDATLFAADASWQGWDGDCDVLKVAHHGGADSTLQDFVNVVKPEYAVISVGENNKHNHPRQETLDRLTASGSEIYMTMEKGSIVLTVSGSGLAWQFSETVPAAQLFGIGQLTYSQMLLNGSLRYPLS